MRMEELAALEKLLAGDSVRLRFLSKARLADACERNGRVLTHAQGGWWVALCKDEAKPAS